MTGIRRWMHIVALGLAAWLLASCTGADRMQTASANVVQALSGEAAAGFARAYEPIPFEFPHDHGSHPDYQTEWWYYTGNLNDEFGNPHGYQFTLFRSALTPEMPARPSGLATNQVYMAHFALTDGAAGRHRSFERFSRGAGNLAAATGDPSFTAWLEDWSVQQGTDDTMRIVAASDDGQTAIDLTLQATRPPVLHGTAGLSQKGPEAGNASYYYSLVGLETTGTITSSGQARAVDGVSWMDHEFGTSALSENAVGWDWFSLQLDNGAALMFAQIRTDDGSLIDQFQGTLVYPDGSQLAVGAEDFTLQGLDQWTSPRSGATYPSGWRVTLPAQAIDLVVEPLIQDQEMETSFIYWEGAVVATGSMAGQPVAGNGYVELTGYSGQPSEYQR